MGEKDDPLCEYFDVEDKKQIDVVNNVLKLIPDNLPRDMYPIFGGNGSKVYVHRDSRATSTFEYFKEDNSFTITIWGNEENRKNAKITLENKLGFKLETN